MRSTLRSSLQTALGPRYVIDRVLGGGGMSETFVARDTTLGREIVVKVLAPSLADSVNLERFQREIALAATLQHPNLLPVLDSGVVDGLPYYTMPFVAGESLRARLAKGPLPIADAVGMLRDVARALGAAHAAGVVHRDVKPDNVLLAGDAAVLTDLGIAKALSDSARTPGATLTKAGLSLGTPAYFAPEQATGDQITPAADWYAFGVMAFEMLTGRLPFTAANDAGLLVAHLTIPAPEIAPLRTDLPPALATLVMRCLAKEPGQRIAVASQILALLDQAGGGDAQNASGADNARADSTRPRRASGRRRLASGALAATVIVGAAALWTRGQPPRTEDIAVSLGLDGAITALPSADEIGAAGVAPIPQFAPRSVRVVLLASTADAWQAPLMRTAAQVRDQLLRYSAIRVDSVTRLMADLAAAERLARDSVIVVVALWQRRSADTTWLGVRVVLDTTTTPSAFSRRANSCLHERWIPRGQDSAIHRDVTQRTLGAMRLSFDRNSISPLGFSATRSGCIFARDDALQAYARFRLDTIGRTLAQRVVDLDEAIRLDSADTRFQRERARVLNDTAQLRALDERAVASLAEERADTRGVAQVTRELRTDPVRALLSARALDAQGAIPLELLAQVALSARRPVETLRILDRLDALPDSIQQRHIFVQAVVTRLSALFFLGRDSSVVAGAVPLVKSNINRRYVSELLMLSTAALGDSVRWRAAFQTSDLLDPAQRLEWLSKSAGAAIAQGHTAFARSLYRQMLSEGEPLVEAEKASFALAAWVANARRYSGDADGAAALYRRLAESADTNYVKTGRNRLIVMAAERRDESALTRLEPALRAALDRRDPESAMTYARIAAVRGNVQEALSWLRRYHALGGVTDDQRGYYSRWLRIDPDFRILRTTAEGRAFLYPVD